MTDLRPELVSGLKIAIERGESLQAAMQTFILAGYNPEEVQEAARNINMGVSNRIQIENIQTTTKTIELNKPEKEGFFSKLFKKKSTETQKEVSTNPYYTQKIITRTDISETKHKSKGRVILTIILILIVIILLGALALSIF